MEDPQISSSKSTENDNITNMSTTSDVTLGKNITSIDILPGPEAHDVVQPKKTTEASEGFTLLHNQDLPKEVYTNISCTQQDAGGIQRTGSLEDPQVSFAKNTETKAISLEATNENMTELRNRMESKPKTEHTKFTDKELKTDEKIQEEILKMSSVTESNTEVQSKETNEALEAAVSKLHNQEIPVKKNNSVTESKEMYTCTYEDIEGIQRTESLEDPQVSFVKPTEAESVSVEATNESIKALKISTEQKKEINKELKSDETETIQDERLKKSSVTEAKTEVRSQETHAALESTEGVAKLDDQEIPMEVTAIQACTEKDIGGVQVTGSLVDSQEGFVKSKVIETVTVEATKESLKVLRNIVENKPKLDEREENATDEQLKTDETEKKEEILKKSSVTEVHSEVQSKETKEALETPESVTLLNKRNSPEEVCTHEDVEGIQKAGFLEDTQVISSTSTEEVHVTNMNSKSEQDTSVILVIGSPVTKANSGVQSKETHTALKAHEKMTHEDVGGIQQTGSLEDPEVSSFDSSENVNITNLSVEAEQKTMLTDSSPLTEAHTEVQSKETHKALEAPEDVTSLHNPDLPVEVIARKDLMQRTGSLEDPQITSTNSTENVNAADLRSDKDPLPITEANTNVHSKETHEALEAPKGVIVQDNQDLPEKVTNEDKEGSQRTSSLEDPQISFSNSKGNVDGSPVSEAHTEVQSKKTHEALEAPEGVIVQDGQELPVNVTNEDKEGSQRTSSLEDPPESSPNSTENVNDTNLSAKAEQDILLGDRSPVIEAQNKVQSKETNYELKIPEDITLQDNRDLPEESHMNLTCMQKNVGSIQRTSSLEDPPESSPNSTENVNHTNLSAKAEQDIILSDGSSVSEAHTKVQSKETHKALEAPTGVILQDSQDLRPEKMTNEDKGDSQKTSSLEDPPESSPNSTENVNDTNLSAKEKQDITLSHRPPAIETENKDKSKETNDALEIPEDITLQDNQDLPKKSHMNLTCMQKDIGSIQRTGSLEDPPESSPNSTENVNDTNLSMKAEQDITLSDGSPVSEAHTRVQSKETHETLEAPECVILQYSQDLPVNVTHKVKRDIQRASSIEDPQVSSSNSKGNVHVANLSAKAKQDITLSHRPPAIEAQNEGQSKETNEALEIPEDITLQYNRDLPEESHMNLTCMQKDIGSIQRTGSLEDPQENVNDTNLSTKAEQDITLSDGSSVNEAHTQVQSKETHKALEAPTGVILQDSEDLRPEKVTNEDKGGSQSTSLLEDPQISTFNRKGNVNVTNLSAKAEKEIPLSDGSPVTEAHTQVQSKEGVVLLTNQDLTEKVGLNVACTQKDIGSILTAGFPEDPQVSFAKSTENINVANLSSKSEEDITLIDVIDDSQVHSFTCNESNLNSEAEHNAQAESAKQTQIFIQSETNIESVTNSENQREGVDILEQLDLQRVKPICSSTPELVSDQAHFTLLEATPAPLLDHLHDSQQQGDHSQTVEPCESISEHETTHHNHSIGGVDDEKHVPEASADTTAIDFGYADAKPEHGQEMNRSLDTCPLESENVFRLGSEVGIYSVVRGNTRNISKAGVEAKKEEEEEEEEEASALEEASAPAVESALPLTTPTMPEMIESERVVGEKEIDDAVQRAAATVTLKAPRKENLVQITKLQESDQSLLPSSAGTECEIIASIDENSEISSETNSSPTEKAEKVETTFEVGCSSKMPHSSEKDEKKGGGPPVDGSPGKGTLSATAEKETSAKNAENRTVISTSPLGLYDRRDWKGKSSESLERKGKGGTEASEEEGREREQGGVQTVFTQQAAHTKGLSLTETETHPLHDNPQPMVSSQQRGEPVTSVTTCRAETALPPITSSRTEVCSSANLSSPLSISTETARKAPTKSEAHLNESWTESALEEKLPSSDKSQLPAASADGKDSAVQASDQQVQSTSVLTQTPDSGTRMVKKGTEKDTIQRIEDQRPLSTSHLEMRDVTGTFRNVEGIACANENVDSPGNVNENTVLSSKVNGFASLPPLTFHENLHHPVSETSFNFQGFLSTGPAEALQKTTTSESPWEALRKTGTTAVNETIQKHDGNDTKDETVENVTGKSSGGTPSQPIVTNVSMNALNTAEESRNLEVIQENEEAEKQTINLTLGMTHNSPEDALSSEPTSKKHNAGLQDTTVPERESNKGLSCTVLHPGGDPIVSDGDVQKKTGVFVTIKEVNEKDPESVEYNVDVAVIRDKTCLSDRTQQESELTDESNLPGGVEESSMMSEVKPLLSASKGSETENDLPVYSTNNTACISQQRQESEPEQTPAILNGCCQIKPEDHTQDLQNQEKPLSLSVPLSQGSETDNTLPVLSTNNSSGISQQSQKSEQPDHPPEVSKICSQIKPEDQIQVFKNQTDSGHDNGAVPEIAKDFGGTKDLTSPAMDVLDQLEGNISLPNIQSDPKVPIVLRPPGPMLSHIEFINDCDISFPGKEVQFSSDHKKISTLNNGNDVEAGARGDTVRKTEENCKTEEKKGEKEQNDVLFSTDVLAANVMTTPESSMQKSQLAPINVELHKAGLAGESLNNDGNPSERKDVMINEDTEVSNKQSNTAKGSDSAIIPTKDIIESFTKPETEQNIETLLHSRTHHHDEKINRKMSPANTIDLSSDHSSSVDVSADNQASSTQNSLRGTESFIPEESSRIESFKSISTVTAQPSAFDVTTSTLSNMAKNVVKDDIVVLAGPEQLIPVNTKEIHDKYDSEEIQRKTHLRQQEKIQLIEEQYSTVKQNASEDEKHCDEPYNSFENQITEKEQVAKDLKEEKTNTSTEQTENYRKSEEELKKEYTNKKHGDHKETAKEKDDKEEKPVDETVPGKTLKATVLSDPDLVSPGLPSIDQGCGRSLIEGTHPFMDQDLSVALPVVQESCCEIDQIKDQKILSELDCPVPNMNFQPLGPKQPQELQCTAVLCEGLQMHEGVCQEETMVNDLSSQDQDIKLIPDSNGGAENVCSSLGNSESISLLGNNEKESEKELEAKVSDLENVSSIKSVTSALYKDEAKINNTQTENQGDNLSSTTVANPEDKEVKPVLSGSSNGHEREPPECTSQSDLKVDKSENLDHGDTLTEHSNAAKLPLNDSTKPIQNSSSSHKEEDQSFSVVILGNSNCSKECNSQTGTVLATVPGTPESLSKQHEAESTVKLGPEKTPELATPLLDPVLQNKIENDNMNEASQDIKEIKKEMMKNEAQLYPVESSQTETMALENVDPSLSHSNQQQQDIELFSPKTCTGTKEEDRNMATQAAISAKVQQMEHRKEEIGGYSEENGKNEPAENRKFREMCESAKTRSSEPDLKDRKEGNESKALEYVEETSMPVTLKTQSGTADGLQTEMKRHFISESSVCLESSAVSVVTNSQDSSQMLLNTCLSAQPSEEATKSFVQILRENLSESESGVSHDLTDSSHGDSHGEVAVILVSDASQKMEMTDGGVDISRGSKHEEEAFRTDTNTSVSQIGSGLESTRTDVSLSKEITLETMMPDVTGSCESSNWIKEMREAVSVSEIPLRTAENRPFESLNSPQADFQTPTEESIPPVREQLDEPPDSRSPEKEAAEESEPSPTFPPPPEEDFLFPPPPDHLLHDSSEFPTPPPTPPERAPSEPELVPEAELESKPEPEPQCRPEPEPEPVPVVKPEPKPEIQPKWCESEPDPEPKPVLKPESKSEPKPEIQPNREPEPELEPKPVLNPEIQSNREPKPDPEPKPELKPELEPKAEAVPPSNNSPQTQSVPHNHLKPEQLQAPPARSSDSDGAFETPESTTPVKTAAPPLPAVEQTEPTQPLPPTDTDPCLGPVSTVDASAGDESSSPSFQPPSRSLSIVFDEDKPIASSGAYNLDHLLAADPFPESSGPQGRTPLTRSLSLQSGELDSYSPGDRPAGGATEKYIHPRAESFSVGTESAPGTLRRVKKPRPGSLKKKPLSRQNSNPESATSRAGSSSSTPEVKKRGKPRAETPPQVQDEQERPTASPSPSPSPAGTLRRSKIKPRVESPPPVAEESIFAPAPDTAKPAEQQDKSSPVPDKDSPIPPSASYKWDPDNFENIDPFCTGGSKIANSPVFGRKTDFAKADFAPVPEPPRSPPVPAEEPLPTLAAPRTEQPVNIEEQPIPKRQPIRLEFDYSEESGETSQDAPLPPKKLGKKPGAKMPLRKPKLGIKKAPPTKTEQLDNAPIRVNSNDNDDIPISKGSYNFDPNKWEDPNFNPFSSNQGIPNSPGQSRASYSFDADSFNDSNKMGNSPPKAASFEVSSNDNDNDNISELEDHNQNKPAKNKKKPLKSKSSGFSSLCCLSVKRSPKRSPVTDQSAQDPPADTLSDHAQDHATDEEKLASSTNQKWTARHDVEAELTSDVQDFPQPSDLTAFVTGSNLPAQNHDYEIEYMEKIGTSTPPLSVKKPSLYLNLDPVTDSSKQSSCMHDSGPNSPCTGSFEEMEAQMEAEGKSPVLPACGPPETLTEKSRKRENQSQSRAQSSERDGAPPSQGPVEPSDLSLLDRLSESAAPLSYLEPDLAETNPTAFAQKLQEELVLAALRIEALQVAKNISQSPSLSTVSPQSRLKKPSPRRWNINSSAMSKQRDVASPGDSGVSKSSIYSRTGYSETESPYLPRELDHSLGIAREEVVSKEKEVLEWKRKYEESQQELQEMKRIVAEYEKTIAQMIEKPITLPDSATEDEQREKSLSHHTIQQLILEKDQALADLNSVEKSLADLFRRYEKMKDVLEGFRKNEEVLKKCAQEYLSRVRKEEQRYQALKIHAEEKLDKANAEIAQVRTKAKQEQVAYQASLRKEQMKVDSLERTLDQKNKEIEELTKICDELIAKMGKS
uniref:Transforming acidic coiled-coil-containing protein C-terminal domain-containing protein n=1 Tax=Astyanax mexicanus TaxID=7994 RepID=A0A3B1J7V1_ASTMX